MSDALRHVVRDLAHSPHVWLWVHCMDPPGTCVLAVTSVLRDSEARHGPGQVASLAWTGACEQAQGSWKILGIWAGATWSSPSLPGCPGWAQNGVEDDRRDGPE